MTPKEGTYQVILDIIKNTSFYKAFLASADVPEIYMQQFWHTVSKALNICPRVPGKEFSVPPSEEELLTFLIGLSYKGKKRRGKWSQGKNSVDTPKPASVDVSDESDFEPTRKRTGSRRVIKKKVSISTKDNMIPEPNVTLELGKSMSLTKAAAEEAARQVYATHESIMTESNPETARIRPSGIAFRDTSSMLKKMSPDLSQKLKGGQTLTPKEQLATDTMGIPEEEKVYFDKEEEKKDNDEDDKSIDIEETGDEETDDEFVREITDTAKADAEKTEEVKDDTKKAELPPSSSSLSVSSGFDNKFLNLSLIRSTVTLTTTPPPPHYVSTISHVPQQTTTPIPTPPITTVAPAVTTIPDPLPTIIQRVSFLEKDVQELKEADHTTTHLGSLRSEIPSAVNAYLRSSLGDAFQKVLQKNTKELIQQYPHQVNYKDVIEESIQANVINKVKNLLPKFLPKAISDFATPVIQSNVNKALEKTLTVVAQSSSQAQSSLKAAESLSEYELKMILFEKMDKSCSYLTRDKHQALFDVLFNSLCLDDVITRGKKTKRRRTKESESSKKTSATKETSKGNASTKGSKSNKFVHAKESVVEPTEEVIMDASNDDVVNDVDQPQNEPTPKHSCIELEYNIEECYKALSDQLDWNNPEGDRYPKKKYTTSITKTKVVRYELVGIDDMIPSLWSETKVGYDKDAERGIKHWGPKHQLFYKSHLNRFSKHDVYSHLKILSVKSVKVNKLHGYGFLEEIVVRRADRQLYKFKEGDFVNLHLNDIEDMLLLVVQHKLFQLDGSGIINLAVALHFPGISVKELYTPSLDPPGVVYEDLNKQKRVMRADELYKFSDGTLKLVRAELHHRILNFCLGYNKEMSRIKWFPNGGSSDEVLKLKNFKKDDYTSFQDKERYEHVGLKVTRSQEGKRSQDDEKRRSLGRHLEEIHVTCALSWKKRDKSTTLHKRRLEELLTEGGDGVKNTCDAV
ncbi:hypothetical protein Tco_1303268 [Tanacetum coccineum]